MGLCVLDWINFKETYNEKVIELNNMDSDVWEFFIKFIFTAAITVTVIIAITLFIIGIFIGKLL